MKRTKAENAQRQNGSCRIYSSNLSEYIEANLIWILLYVIRSLVTKRFSSDGKDKAEKRELDPNMGSIS